ncbi:MAG: SusD/RagB family nutrient-binding outer membrane lipoprotein [Rikenellaceae bacterium]
MKNILKKLSVLGFALMFTLGSCSDFEDVNSNPFATDESNVEPRYLLSQAIFLPQQDPHIAERVFILYWDRVARMETAGGLAILSGSDSWTSDYYSLSYLLSWVNYTYLTINAVDAQMESGTYSEAANNIKQVARIWRAYLLSEIADNFGPVPLDGFQGENPTYSSVEDTYKFMLEELADATANIDLDATFTTNEAAADLFYQGNATQWVKFANSLRLRYAMRLQGVSPSYAQTQFEDAASDITKLITDNADIASVIEYGSWTATTAVMSRSWNTQPMSFTMANLSAGLGGTSLHDISTVYGTAAYGLTADVIDTYAKDPTEYLGILMPTLQSTKTNINNAGYFMDCMPLYVDPRALVNYSIPGHDDGTVGTYTTGTTASVRLDATTSPDTLSLRAQYSWFGSRFGQTGDQGTLFADFTNTSANVPTKSKVYRDNNSSRIFFAPWETYFLIAEAAHYGWSVPLSAQVAYEAGIASSFEYNGLSSLYNDYIESTSLNMVGTSVKFTDNTETASKEMTYIDLASNMVLTSSKNYEVNSTPTYSTTTYEYPVGLYSTNNDALTKIITQKYIAQTPWLPNEAWSDYRRLGLPFFENPVLEYAISTMPNYTDYTKADINNIGQRLEYPSSLQNTNPSGYSSALEALGGADDYSTPLWWSKAATGN